MIVLRVKKLVEHAILPVRATQGSACFDFFCLNRFSLGDNDVLKISTGIAVEIPPGHVGLLFIRSSLSLQGISLANSVGVIDSDYRGEIIFALKYSPGPYDPRNYECYKQERIGQLLVIPIPQVALLEVPELSPTRRADGGFGSTGK